ncbi:MAG: hypothetical protein M3O86_01745 [Actinomycetota bacterium]|nr:hypothetical protein [Actinomycetota bacterium]
MRVLLFNLRSRKLQRLDHGGDGTLLQPGDVSGKWVTWTRCRSPKRCRTLRYDVRSNDVTKLPNPRRRSQFGASVLPGGTEFYGESRNIATCGSRLAAIQEARLSTATARQAPTGRHEHLHDQPPPCRAGPHHGLLRPDAL